MNPRGSNGSRDPGRQPLRARRLRDLQRVADRVAYTDEDGGYLYRPGELLVSPDMVNELRAETRGISLEPDEEANARLGRRDLQLQRWRLRGDVRLPALERTLARAAEARQGVAAVNHVFTGEPIYWGGPGGEPEPSTALSVPQPVIQAAQSTAALAVLDTGVPVPTPPFIAGALIADTGADIDLLDEDADGELDTQAGHGTFIVGLAQRVVPGLPTEQQKVLDSMGFGDDLSVCLGLAEADAPVINLSLGGYTGGNRPPRGLRHAIRRLGRTRVIVAAAGNNGSDRPFWPAAFPEVVAVSAYDSRTEDAADFSNFGEWVDVSAPGVELRSCFVDGTRENTAGDVTFDGWATWSGTSFAAPLVAAEIARRVAAAPPGEDPRRVADDFLSELPPAPWTGHGRRYEPKVDLTA
jgi:subtilisin family serine protease